MAEVIILFILFFPGDPMWEVQRCLRKWGRSKCPTSVNEALAYVLTRVCLQVDFNSRNPVMAERQTFYCVPIPGENAWVKEIS